MHSLLGERGPWHFNPLPFGRVGDTRGNVGAVVSAGVREAALAGMVVSVVFWCVQNISNEREK